MSHLANEFVQITHYVNNPAEMTIGDVMEAVFEGRSAQQVRVVETPPHEYCPEGCVLVMCNVAAGYAVTDSELADMVIAELEDNQGEPL